MLKKNKGYTISQLTKIYGGNPQPSMPFVKGEVPYCKFDPKINPEFPKKAWIEIGPLRKKGAEFLINCRTKIPVFKKEGTNNWKYIGLARILNDTNRRQLNKINKKPPRDKIQIILKFKFDE